MSVSEVARLRQQIELEYQAARRGLSGMAITARHDFIEKRQERLADYFQELRKHMSPEEAMKVFVEVENAAKR